MAEKQQIPRIDLSGVDMSMRGSERWKEVATQVLQALQLYGCFQALHEHSLTPELRAKVLLSVRDELFALPMETKLKDASEKPFHGYSRPGPDAETFGIMNPIPLGIPNFVNQLWPQSDNPKFREIAEEYTKKVVEVEATVRCMLLEELGVKEKHAAQLAESIWYSIRFSKYERQSALIKNEPEAGPKPHRDYKLLTVVWQLNDVDGLEVLSKEGDRIAAKLSSSSSLMVFAGNCLMAWSNGRINAPLHRVMVSENKNQESFRYSAMLFSAPNDELKVEAPEELVDDQHPRLYKPFTLPELFNFTFSQEGNKTDCPLTAKFSLNA